MHDSSTSFQSTAASRTLTQPIMRGRRFMFLLPLLQSGGMCILRPMVEFQPWSFVDKMSLSLMLVVISIGVCVSFCDPVCFCFCFFFVCVVFVSSSLLVSSMIQRVRFLFLFLFLLFVFSGA